MDSILLSDLERYYLIQGAELGCRMDGRAPNEYRPVEIETGILSHTNGSASIRLGETFVMCCVKVEVGKPSLESPNEGRLEINVECYPTATSSCSDKSATEISESLKTTLQSAYQTNLFDLKSLCIQPGRQCWVTYVDLLLLEGGGNFLDASSLAIKAAMIDASRQSSKKHEGDIQEQNKQTKSNLPFLKGENLPIIVTVHKIGNAHLIDASKEEEACSLSRLSVVIHPDGSLGSLVQVGCGSCQLETIVQMSELAVTIGKELNEALIKTIDLEFQLRS